MYKEIVTSKQSKEFREKYICVSNLHFQSNQTVSLSELDLFHSTKPTQNTAGTAGLWFLVNHPLPTDKRATGHGHEKKSPNCGKRT